MSENKALPSDEISDADLDHVSGGTTTQTKGSPTGEQQSKSSASSSLEQKMQSAISIADREQGGPSSIFGGLTGK